MLLMPSALTAELFPKYIIFIIPIIRPRGSGSIRWWVCWTRYLEPAITTKKNTVLYITRTPGRGPCLILQSNKIGGDIITAIMQPHTVILRWRRPLLIPILQAGL